MNYKREVYLSAVKTQLDTNIFNHSLALEACMSGLYNYFKNNNLLDINEPSKDEWMLAGLIHDIDFSGDYKQFHPTKTREVLSKFNLEISDRIYNTIQAHDSRISGIKCINKAEWSIFCADSLTGLIVAVALVYPTKKLVIM